LAPPKAPQKHHYETRTQNLPIANSDGFSSLSIESLSPFFSLSLCILLGVLENEGEGGGGVLFQIKTIAEKKKGGLRKRQTTNQEEKPQNEILLATTKPHDTRSETAEERQQ
jgi:hypothetical protein